MISLKHKCIFIEVPKTGSTSIRNVIGISRKPHLDIKEYRDILKMNFPFETMGYKYVNALYCTITLNLLKSKIGDKIFTSFFKFGIVRNPWSRAVSLYLRNEAIQMKNKLTFEGFVGWIQNSSDICIHSSTKKNQLGLLMEIIVDYIGKFEEITKAWNYFNDTKQLQNNVELLLDDETLCKNIVQNVKRVALERYNWEKIINKYDKIL